MAADSSRSFSSASPSSPTSLPDELASWTHVTLEGNFGMKYTLSAEPLASGGYGSVYKATDEDGEVVAVKYYSPQVRFEDVVREFTLQHYLTRRNVPHICRYLDGPIQTPQGAYIVMEFIPGRTLHHLIAATREQTWSRTDALAMSETFLSLMRQLAAVVQRLHEECVVHYDLKPVNIMVRETGELIVMDLGLGCFQQDCPTAEEVQRAGEPSLACFQRETTYGYIAPEINRGQVVIPGEYDFRKVDVYALGKVLADLATGRMAYEQSLDFDRALHRRPMEEALAELDTNNPELNLVIRGTALAKDPDRRWSSAEVVQRLQHIRVVEPLAIFLARQ